MKPIFITGTGTDVGKTLVCAILAEALQADYWKPVQAGFSTGTDAEWVQQMISNGKTKIHPELYKLAMPASPHIAAKNEDKKISIKAIADHLPKTKNRLIIEGAGGVMVPLNDRKFMLDLIKKLKAKVIIVSKNELGSINHSLLTAAVLKKEKADVTGWIFNQEYLSYESEIAKWSGYSIIASVKHLPHLTKEAIREEAVKMKAALGGFL
ncbi:MAG TPA: dethiobiotin synthase [Chitinophagaceae bacterium]|nr:dethiobiotin synthase [Chitinophagaceae bacterium]